MDETMIKTQKDLVLAPAGVSGRPAVFYPEGFVK